MVPIYKLTIGFLVLQHIKYKVNLPSPAVSIKYFLPLYMYVHCLVASPPVPMEVVGLHIALIGALHVHVQGLADFLQL